MKIVYGACGTTSSTPTYKSCRCQKKKENKKLKTYLKKKMTENFSNLVKEIDMQAGESQSPKRDEHKEAHSKTHHN